MCIKFIHTTFRIFSYKQDYRYLCCWMDAVPSFKPYLLKLMKNILNLLPCCILLLIGCSGGNNSVDLQPTVDALNALVANQEVQIKLMRDTISKLQFPADQRLAEIKQLIASEKYTEAKMAIAGLESIFPNSQEALQCASLIETIDTRLAAIEAEQERIKAQGFKVFKDNMTCSDDGKKFSFSGFTFGREFTFDYCDDVNEYSYRTADKDKTYLLFSLRLSTKEMSAYPPSIYIYELAGDKLKYVTFCSREYADWISYSAKIGNYPDDSHDFSKVNAVRYKFAGEIKQSMTKRPLFVLFAKNGHQIDSELSATDVQNKCIIIKVLNRNAI